MVAFDDPVTIGYFLIGLGVLLFLLEAAMPGFFIGVPAAILVLLGVFALVVPDLNLFTVWAPVVVVAVGVPATFVAIWSYRRMAVPDRAPTTRTATNLVGEEALVLADVLPESTRGKVKVGTESWSATTRGAPIAAGARVRVVDVDGIILVVQPLA